MRIAGEIKGKGSMKQEITERSGITGFSTATHVKPQSETLHSSKGEGGLEHFFDFDLEANPSREPYVSSRNREGAFITNSTGTMTGEKIRGRIKLSFFAQDCAYLLVQAGIEPSPGQHLCKENDGGIIETEDGAKITVDTKGYGLRGADAAIPRKWRLAMTVQFSTSDERYSWLNTAFGFWEGEFDENTGRASYRGYIRRYP
jgi:Protein of unknown function (DUF3237)